MIELDNMISAIADTVGDDWQEEGYNPDETKRRMEMAGIDSGALYDFAQLRLEANKEVLENADCDNGDAFLLGHIDAFVAGVLAGRSDTFDPSELLGGS